MKQKKKEFAEKALRLLYPHTCPFCGRVTEREVCSDCAGKVVYIHEPFCKMCGKPLQKEQQEYCLDCMGRRHFFSQGRALWPHQKETAWSIYQFKYHNRRIHGSFYAEKMAERYGGYLRKRKILLMIPIPLSRKKRRKRGFNQAEILACELSRRVGVPADSCHLLRIRDTIPQKVFDPAARRANVSGIFVWKGPRLTGLSVLLLDDIYTTGSTLDSAALTLKKAGARKVYFLTISIGQGY